MHNTYWYDGPKELGSVIAHQCGAVGLFSSKDNPDLMLHASVSKIAENTGIIEVRLLCHARIQDHLILCVDRDTKDNVHLDYVQITSFTGEDTVEGRKLLGRKILGKLRSVLGKTGSLWGILVGVRPTKLTNKLWDSLGDLELVRQELEVTYGISPQKWHLLETVVGQERPYIKQMSSYKEISVYSGIPFCETHCSYCSFPYGMIQSYSRVGAFTKTYCKDILNMLELIKDKKLNVQTLYMGGGTPTSLCDSDFQRVLYALKNIIQTGREFTVEAGRPDSLNTNKIQSIVDAGVTRISLNPQTMQDELLRIIGRGHSVAEFLSVYEYVVSNTDCSINMDFITGLPRQTVKHMEENVRYIEQLRPHNVTIHTLALKKGSPLYGSGFANEIPSEDVVQTMLDETHEALLQLGYIPYYMYRQQYMVGQMENIGYTLPNYECIYNIQMIEERQSILSIGPGSVSKWIGGTDFRQQKQYMPKDVDTYIQDIDRLLEKRIISSEMHWRDD